ncbi:MAG: hypothetical protein SGJ04_00535 [Bacteroidota bacterium]|nr:hypothetical protein [Bacteroidota bacterium]
MTENNVALALLFTHKCGTGATKTGKCLSMHLYEVIDDYKFNWMK